MVCNRLDSTMTAAVLVLGIPLYVALMTAFPAFWPVANPVEMIVTTELLVVLQTRALPLRA